MLDASPPNPLYVGVVPTPCEIVPNGVVPVNVCVVRYGSGYCPASPYAARSLLNDTPGIGSTLENVHDMLAFGNHARR